MTKDLHDITNKTIKLAQKKGADFSEAFLIKGNRISIEIEDSSIVKANNQSVSGIGMRIIKDKAVALGSSTQFQHSLLDNMVKEAVLLAKASSADPAIIGLAEPIDSYPEVKGLYDKKLAALNSSELVDLAITGINAAHEINKEIKLEGQLVVSDIQNYLANNNGIDLHSAKTSINFYLQGKLAKSDDDIGVAYELQFGRHLADVDPAEVGRIAAEKTIKMLGAKKIDSGEYPFILDERAARRTINGIIDKGISAYNIDQGTAYFTDRLGEQIASNKLTVLDNPLEKGGYNSTPYDDEGTACSKKVLVENGTLLTYLSDVYTSHKLDIPNTGSAQKRGYDGIPHPKLQQIQIQGGSASKDELFSELDTGLYLESPLMAMTGTNISQQVDVGFWVEQGEIQFPVKNTMLGTTVYEVLQNIQMLGKNVLDESGLKSPMVLIGKTKFSGGK
ncbi:MAG: TldD/PmbA family protein [Asgard group archaeon]|nr:TldD/PmbA family protein [Asgard group archaeon]